MMVWKSFVQSIRVGHSSHLYSLSGFAVFDVFYYVSGLFVRYSRHLNLTTPVRVWQRSDLPVSPL